jgi:hypothetical protein
MFQLDSKILRYNGNSYKNLFSELKTNANAQKLPQQRTVTLALLKIQEGQRKKEREDSERSVLLNDVVGL